MAIIQKPNKRLTIGIIALLLAIVLPGRWVALALRAARFAFTSWALGEIRGGQGWPRRILGLIGLAASNRAVRRP